MESLETALKKILATVELLPRETVPLDRAFGRFATAKILSRISLPPHDNSSVDGYAVKADDLVRATAESSVTLSLAGYSPAGGFFLGVLQSGECIRIFTGSALPSGADAVVMQEDVKTAPAQPREVIFSEPVRPFENVRFLGEDVQKGAAIISVGDKLTAGRIGLLAATGVKNIKCRRQPVVAILATGSELREAGESLEPGTIYESNRVTLSAMARQTGAIVKTPPLIPDKLDTTKFALEQAFENCDVVVTTGGVSVGDLDWVRTAFQEIGGELDFFGVEIRPGKPFAFGRQRGKYFFGLPGNPVSAMVTFHLLVRPALLRLQDAAHLAPPFQNATLSEPLANDGGRRHFFRVTFHDDNQVRSAGKQASHVLSATALSDGLVMVPPKTTFPAGTVVKVVRWE